MSSQGLLIALEGGGTRTQAALFDVHGRLLSIAEGGDVNTNFTTPQRAAQNISEVIAEALRHAGETAEHVNWAPYALVAAQDVVKAALRAVLPKAELLRYTEMHVVFARAGIFPPHGVALVAGTGSTAFGIRHDDGRRCTIGGWGALLGDEGGGYAIGLAGLRAAVRAFEGRAESPSLVPDVCRHFGVSEDEFRPGLIFRVYRQSTTRAEIAGFSRAVSRLAADGDAVCRTILEAAAMDLAELVICAAGKLFTRDEEFVVAAAGGVLQAGSSITHPLQRAITAAYPLARQVIGEEAPAVALGQLALSDITRR